MKNKNKITILILGIFGFLLGIFIFNFYYFYDDVNMETNANDKEVNNRLITIMLEETRGSGTYKVSKSSKWPSKGYIFNEEMSYCKNDSKLTWNENDNSVSVKVNKADKCFVYFDVEPGDINITLNNYSNTVGKSASIKCSNSNVVYNELYNRIEVSDINAKYEKCYVNYEERETKTNFADYIMSLEGTEQGDGQLVREQVNLVDYDNVESITESEYDSYRTFYNNSATSDSGTLVTGVFAFSNNEWTTGSSTLISGKYYHFNFRPKENGYYEICYSLSIGSTDNSAGLVFKESIKSGFSAKTTEAQQKCYDFGYLSTNDVIGLYFKVGTEISTFSFSLKKENVISTVDAGYRYKGSDPNNYVWFNNEYWRIIGVFDENTHGQLGKNMVKIVRESPLSRSTYDLYTKRKILLNLLNDAYYNAEDGTNSGSCYVTTNIQGNCDYTKKGIQSDYRDMVANVTWYLGKPSSSSANAEQYYKYERGLIGTAKSDVGYIGLIYSSDYGFGSLNTACGRSTLIDSGTYTCTRKNWLYFGDDFYVISGDEISSGIHVPGTISTNPECVYPSLYLVSSTFLISGNGSMDNPFIIGL